MGKWFVVLRDTVGHTWSVFLKVKHSSIFGDQYKMRHTAGVFKTRRSHWKQLGKYTSL